MTNKAFRFADLPSTYDEKRQSAVLPSDLAYIHQRIEIGTLLANHSISRDAINAVVREVYVRHIPIVAEGASVVDAFNGYVTTHSTEMPEIVIHPSCHVMILQRVLDLTRSTHCVTLRNPLASTATPKYLKLKKRAIFILRMRRTALFPYRKHLRGFTSFKVVGNVESSLAEILSQLADGDLWSRTKAKSVGGWSGTVTEIFSQLNANLAASTLRIMAFNASQTFNTNWRRTTQQEERLRHRVAFSLRIAQDSVLLAEQRINLAAQHSLDDSAI
ncbi:hypothetical protein F4861DRAFT_546091 [Xylaria intraflava]|nr:hypothetical protein F4861DRAFT_546091 [Xylaria intraflava]